MNSSNISKDKIIILAADMEIDLILDAALWSD